jgi:NAD(P)-dependent dehydrogenase (short-subunit alcohol dehydrogenase family)
MSNPNRVAIVTGGGAGIGRACVLQLVREGAAVLVGDVSEADGAATCQLAKGQGGQVVFCPADVASESDCQRLAKTALDAWGRTDVLVANAGARVYGSILDASEADWEKILGVNLKGVAYCCKAVLPVMIRQKGGAIVIVSSANAIVGRASMPLYDATKAGELSIARSLAVAHGRDGIRINAVCPGYTMTDFHERAAAKQGISPQQLREKNQGYALLGRPAEPHEVASAICFLAGDGAAMITGQYLMVDGGYSVAQVIR